MSDRAGRFRGGRRILYDARQLRSGDRSVWSWWWTSAYMSMALEARENNSRQNSVTSPSSTQWITRTEGKSTTTLLSLKIYPARAPRASLPAVSTPQKTRGKARRRHASPQASIVTTFRSCEHQSYLPAQQPRVLGGGTLYGRVTGGGAPRAWEELSDGQTET